MADSWARIDVNDVPSLIAVTDDADQFITRLLVDPTTGRLLVSALGAMGDVVGPASSVANDIAIFADTTGKLLADSGAKVTDLVPYVGAISDITLGSFGITTLKGIAIGDTVMGEDISGFFFPSKLIVHNDSDLTFTFISETHSDSSGLGNIHISSRSRGTEAAQTIVQDGDNLGNTYWAGFDGTDYEPGAQMRVDVQGSPAGDSMPTIMTFGTTPVGGTGPVDALQIDNTQNVSILVGGITIPTGQTYKINGVPLVLDDLGDVIIASPTVDQILKYNGTNWINGAETTVNGGSGIDLFYDTTDSDITGYDTLSRSPQSIAEQDLTVTANNNTVLFKAYASASTGIGGTQIDAGVWTFDIYAYASLLTLESHIKIDIYKRTSGGTETLLFTVNSPTLTSTLDLYSVVSIQQAFAINATDRLVAKVSGVTSNITDTTIHFAFGGTTHYSHFNTPLVTRHNDLAGLQGGTSNEYYHLTSAEYTGSGTGVFARVSSPVFTTPNIGTATGHASLDLPLTGGTMTGDIVMGIGTHINLTVPTTDATSTGPSTNSFNSGYSSTAIGDLVYLDSSATWQKVDADAIATSGGMLGIALSVAASGAPVLVALPGSFVYATAFPTLTVGGTVYAGETAGTIQQTIPTGADGVVRVIGFAIHADKIFFNPSSDNSTVVA